jgi:hypothetical protein
MDVKKLYQEVIVTSLILNLFDAMLTAVAVFAVALLTVNFYRLSVYFALAAAGIFFVKSLVAKIRKNKILMLEHKYPNLRERLRTSYDHKDRTNTVIDDLHTDILDIMKKVDVNAFLNGKEIALRTFMICGFLLTTLYFSAIGFDVLDIRNAITGSVLYQRAQDYTKDIFDLTREEVKERPLLDKPSLIQVGDKDINISIETYNTELDIRDIREPETNDFGGHFPSEVAGAAQEVYEEKIPEEHKEAIKEYFRKINQ